MGTLSTIYDAFTAVVVAALPAGYRQIPMPYDPATAPALYLKKGYGVKVMTGRGLELERGTKRGRERGLSVMLTNEILHLEHDLTGAKAADKALVEDLLAIETAIEGNNSLNGTVAKIDYVDDSGVSFLSAPTPGAAKYLTITVNFLVVYEETLP